MRERALSEPEHRGVRLRPPLLEHRLTGEPAARDGDLGELAQIAIRQAFEQ